MKRLILFLLLVLILALYSFPLMDPDLWWHIKTGEFICANLSLPDEDPFSFVTENSVRTDFILKQYWLAQVLYFGLFKIGGFWGLIAIRITIYLLIFALFLSLAKDLNYYLKTALLGFLIFGLYYYINDRPSALSFLFFAAELYILKKEKFWLMPLLMLIWSNCHGGFIIGDALLLIWVFYGTMKGGLRGRALLFLVFGLFLSLVNPNTFKAFTLTFDTLSGDYAKNIIEFKSPLYIYKTYGPVWLIYLAVSITGIVALLLPRIKQISVRDIIIVTALIAGTVKHFRLAPFLYIAISFLSADYLKAYNIKIPSRLWRVDMAVTVLLIALLIIFRPHGKPEPFLFTTYPVDGAEFILKEKPEKNIFNSFEWGGYLILKLYPEYKVFMDTRALSMNAYTLLQRIETTADIKVLSKLNINTVILYVINPFLLSEVPTLIQPLHDSKDWELVFLKDTTAIFLRNTEKNRPIIEKYKIPKDDVYRQMVLLSALFLRANKNNPYLYFILGDTYVLLKDFEKAKQAYDAGLQIKSSKKIQGKIKEIERKMPLR